MSQAPRARVARRPVHGVLLLDKPLHWSSNDVLQKVKWLLRAEKAGHTGTLDPLASGVLPLCFGAATKFSQLHLDADKCYEAVLHLGVQTTTGDAEGEVLRKRPIHVTPADVERVRQQFLGSISQLPPMYSALKKDGKALYDYARAGIEVERSARQVCIHALDLVLIDSPDAEPVIRATVRCSKGTYIRTLGEDIGEALGCGAHLSFLRRTQTGEFHQTQCVSLAALESMTEQQRDHVLLPVSSLLGGFESIHLPQAEAGRFLSGLRRRGDWADAQRVAVYGPQADLLGTAHVTAGELIADRLLNPLEIAQIAQAAAPAPSVIQHDPTPVS